MAKVGTLLNINGGGRKEKVQKKEKKMDKGREEEEESQEGEEGQDTRNSLAGGMKADLLWQEF